jgi:hypothetical protein
MQEINAWLRSGKAFEVGKSLYMKYGTNSTFKSLLNTQGPTPYNVKKLGADLKALAPAQPAITIDAPIIKIDAATLPHTDITEAGKERQTDWEAPDSRDTADYPKYLQIKQQIQTLYRQIERNRTELDLNDKPSLLRMIAKQVVALHGKLTDYWKLVDYYDEHGCFPLVKPTIEEGRAERTPAEEIQLLRQSTCKAKTRLKNPQCKDMEGTNELIKRNNQRIIELGGKVKA